MSTPPNTSPIREQLQAAQSQIEAWFSEQWLKTPAPFYSSVDLRDAGFKLAPVDTNLFPAGFNNIHPSQLQQAVNNAKEAVKRLCPSAKKLLIIAESHTRNRFYFDSLQALFRLLEQAGFSCRLGTMRPIDTPEMITLNAHEELTLYPLKKQHGKLVADDFIPDAVLLNNDFSDGVPDLLKTIQQPITPPLSMSWATRLKSSHFQCYETASRALAHDINIDPWLINPLFSYCGEINFMSRSGEDCLIRHATNLFTAITQKYHEYHITEKPFLILKADAGTYGMAVMKIDNPEAITTLTRKTRTRMAKGKGGASVTKIIIQEGIPTIQKRGTHSAETVVYLMDKSPIGAFYRSHPDKKFNESLNAPGMVFEPEEHLPYADSVIARLAALGAAYEITQAQPLKTGEA